MTMRLTHLFVLALAGSVTVAATPIATAEQAPDKKTQAKKYVDAGLAAESGADYATAISMYEKAYALIPHPVLLYNIANAHRLAGELALALDFYNQYVAADPKGTQVKASRERIAEIEAALSDAKATADAEAQAKADADADAKAKAEADAKANADADAKANADADAKRPPEPKPARDPGPRTFTPMRIAGVAAGGLGVIALGGGVVFGLKAQGIEDEVSEDGWVFDQARLDEGNAANRTMFLCYGVGAALVATGAVLWVLGKDTHVTPVASETTAGVAFAGTF